MGTQRTAGAKGLPGEGRLMRTICIERAPRIGHHRYPTRTIRLFDSISSFNSHMECVAFVKGVPVFLAGDSFEAWLDGSAGVEFLRPAPENLLHVWPVSKRVNRSGTAGDDPTLIDRIAS